VFWSSSCTSWFSPRKTTLNHLTHSLISLQCPSRFPPRETTLNHSTYILISLQCPTTGHGQTTKLREGVTINKMQKMKFIKQPKNWEAVLISHWLFCTVGVLVSLLIKNQLNALICCYTFYCLNYTVCSMPHFVLYYPQGEQKRNEIYVRVQ
jgi:hypothetical protein